MKLLRCKWFKQLLHINKEAEWVIYWSKIRFNLNDTTELSSTAIGDIFIYLFILFFFRRYFFRRYFYMHIWKLKTFNQYFKQYWYWKNVLKIDLLLSCLSCYHLTPNTLSWTNVRKILYCKLYCYWENMFKIDLLLYVDMIILFHHLTLNTRYMNICICKHIYLCIYVYNMRACLNNTGIHVRDRRSLF